jgi:hypothetical protein
MRPADYSNRDYWKAIVLYGLNSATYKRALAKTLLELARHDSTHVAWSFLSEEFLKQYKNRLEGCVMPQQINPNRQTVMERIISQLNHGNLTWTEAVGRVGTDAFNDVIPRFHNIVRDADFAKERFYEFQPNNKLIIKDSAFEILQDRPDELFDEIDARWGLLEGAFLINREQFELVNDIRSIYIRKGYARQDITKNMPFINGYQNNTCFYCSEPMEDQDIHVDHVLPRQVVHHDEIWNLVLSHSFCNQQKSDFLVAPAYVNKLIARNENIMGSNHPWKKKIQEQLGITPQKRRTSLENHYNNVRQVLGRNYWRGTEHYSAIDDPFYRLLVTKLNNK